MSENAQKLINELNQKIEQAREAYYVKARPIISDAQYDALEAELRSLVRLHSDLAHLAPVLIRVGSDLQKSSSRIKHLRPMLSIENKYTKEEIVDFYRSLGVLCTVEPKRDGISCELRYRNGKLVQALTRGDGESGEDITQAALNIGCIPKSWSGPEFRIVNVNIRGELVMRNFELERINKELAAAGQKTYSSTRNLTAGTVKLKDVTQIRKREIHFIPWDAYAIAQIDENELPDSHFQRMTMLADYGFPQYDGIKVPIESLVLQQLDKLLAFNKQCDINADGVVIKVDSHTKREELGHSRQYTNFQVCYKPQSASGTTYLRRVVWQIGRQGKLTPVAECDPVVLAGATIVRANLNNITWINNMGLKVGAKVEMLRSGDVIPQIIKVLDETGVEIIPPVNCPDCSTELEILDEGKSGIITHWCINPGCPGRVRDLFAFIGDRDILEIDSLGPEMSAQLVNQGYARNIGELFTFQVECLKAIGEMGEEKFAARMAKKGFSGAAILKMVKSMEKAKKADWDRWIAALAIPMISTSLGRVLAQTFKLQDDAMANLPGIFKTVGKYQTTTIEGIGERKTQMIWEWANEALNSDICKQLFDAGVRPRSIAIVTTTGNQPLSGVAFCITGEFPEFGSRESIARELCKLGAVSKSGVSSKTTLLLVGDAPGNTKLSDARKHKIQMADRNWLTTVFKENGIKLESNPKFLVENAD